MTFGEALDQADPNTASLVTGLVAGAVVPGLAGLMKGTKTLRSFLQPHFGKTIDLDDAKVEIPDDPQWDVRAISDGSIEIVFKDAKPVARKANPIPVLPDIRLDIDSIILTVKPDAITIQICMAIDYTMIITL